VTRTGTTPRLWQPPSGGGRYLQWGPPVPANLGFVAAVAFSAYARINNSESVFAVSLVAPYPGSDWATGDRRLVCLAYLPGEPVDYSIQGRYR